MHVSVNSVPRMVCERAIQSTSNVMSMILTFTVDGYGVRGHGVTLTACDVPITESLFRHIKYNKGLICCSKMYRNVT